MIGKATCCPTLRSISSRLRALSHRSRAAHRHHNQAATFLRKLGHRIPTSDSDAGSGDMPAEMTYQQLGPSGLTVSTVGLGCNNFGARMADEDVPAVVNSAIEAGITLFDTADVYGNVGGSEVLLGEALGSRRGEVIIATKFGSDMRGANGPDWGARGSRRYIRIAVENSLRRLGTDWIDLYQLHEPDPNTPIEETLAALTEIVAEGKVRYIGSSNLGGWQVIDADWTSRTSGFEAFISAQNEYSWLNRSAEAELVPALEHTGQSLLPYFPLASGLLTGKYHRGQPAPAGTRLAQNSTRLDKADFDLIEAIQAYAAERGLSMLQLAIGGLAAMPTVGSVIAGATSDEQVKQDVAAGLWVPSGDDLEALLEITKSAV
jgi:aryl-alcohol dehydrogenase-like predicted oxidoreductase